MNISLLEVKDGTEDEWEVRANDGFYFPPLFHSLHHNAWTEPEKDVNAVKWFLTSHSDAKNIKRGLTDQFGQIGIENFMRFPLI